jgi:hypothetical protein
MPSYRRTKMATARKTTGKKNGNGGTTSKARVNRLEVDFWNAPLASRKVRRVLVKLGLDPDSFKTLYLGDKTRLRGDITPNQREAVRRFLAGDIDSVTAREEAGVKGADTFANLCDRVRAERDTATTLPVEGITELPTEHIS